jgi:uncharacterized protein YdeI (YjbR/CyaY-like superfamily)
MVNNVNGFSPGKQADFAEYIGTAKREATQLSRLEKVFAMLRAGEGLNDKYKK